MSERRGRTHPRSGCHLLGVVCHWPSNPTTARQHPAEPSSFELVVGRGGKGQDWWDGHASKAAGAGELVIQSIIEVGRGGVLSPHLLPMMLRRPICVVAAFYDRVRSISLLFASPPPYVSSLLLLLDYD